MQSTLPTLRPYPLPANEAERLATLERYAILDTPPEAAFDRITSLAVRLFGVPISLVSLVDRERQWFKSCFGLDLRETDRKLSFCTYAILADDVLVVPDARRDARFADNPLVSGAPGIRFYAGAPLRTANGANLGTLCLVDMVPHEFSMEQALMLADLAAVVVETMEARLTALRWRDEVAERRQAEDALRDSEAALHQANDELEARILERTAELARANEELRVKIGERQQAKEEADAANAAKSEFLSRMSHELRTPLNAILGFAQVLEMGDLEAQDRDSVEHILKGGRHLLHLINEVLDIARIEAGRLSLSLEPILLAPTLHEVLSLAQPLAASRDIRILNLVPIDADIHVRADCQRLKQVLLNLLSNAVKYNSEAGKVVVSIAAGTGGWLRLKVRDTGPGLSPEEIKKLFVPFERLSAARTRIEGTGIGLALSKRLVEAMGGVIGVDSTLGQGSVFWIELPLAHSDDALCGEGPGYRRAGAWPFRPASGAQTPDTQSPAGKVLYIEDNNSNLRLIERVLQDIQPVQLITAMQGGMGLELARQHHPDVILLDVHLPDIRGDEVLRRLRADAATNAIPIVMISADATPGQRERCLAAGATAYLTKPLDVTHFLTILEPLLTQHKHGEVS